MGTSFDSIGNKGSRLGLCQIVNLHVACDFTSTGSEPAGKVMGGSIACINMRKLSDY